MGLDVDASNSCIPPSCPLYALSPPLPTTVRGEPTVLDGRAGRINSDRPVLLYGSGRLVVVRELSGDLGEGGGDGEEEPRRVKAFVYRGHVAQVTVAKFSPSGAYVASADVRGKLRVWSYDNEEHLCKLDLSSALAGPIRAISWDGDSKRICIVGEGAKTDSSSPCARVIQWDTGVTCGDLGQHTRGRSTSCAFRPCRPMRIVTGGGDDSRCVVNKGPPFARMVDGNPSEQCHTRGAVNCLQYTSDGSRIASVGTDKSVCFYDGKTMELIGKMEDVHNASIYACAWSSDGEFLLTCSADGTVKLIKQSERKVVHSWDVATEQRVAILGEGSLDDGAADAKVPMGGMQMGCAFVNGDVPISVGLNGQIGVLPLPIGLMPSSAGGGVSTTKFLTGHQAAISSLALDHENGLLFTGDIDGTICKWDARTGRALSRFQRQDEETSSVSDETLLSKVHDGCITSMTHVKGKVLSVGWDDMVRVSDGNHLMTKQLKLPAQPNAMASGTDLVAIITVEGLLLVKNNEIVSDLISVPYSALSVAVSQDDKTVCVGGEDCNIHIYSVDSSSEQPSLVECHTIAGGHLKPVHALSLSHDGAKLASADVRDVCVWSVPDWAGVVGKSRWCFHTQRITCLAWSEDGSVLASGGSDDSIYLWSLNKKSKRVHYPFAHRGGVTALEFLKNRERMILASVGSDGCVNQWDITNDAANKFT